MTDVSKGHQGQAGHRLSSFETLVIIFQSTWCNIPKDLILQQHHCEGLNLALKETHSHLHVSKCHDSLLLVGDLKLFHVMEHQVFV